jgi:hypothetical protein
MTYGPPICAACGARESVEAHHLYLRSDGCPDDLTVWLCRPCHARAHGSRGHINHARLTREGLAAAKARGVKLGNPGLNAARDAAVAARDTDLQPILTELRGRSYGTIAAELTKRGITTPRGGSTWNAMTVMRAMKRLEMR